MQPETENTDISFLIDKYAALGEKVCAAMIDAIEKIGIDASVMKNLMFTQLAFSLNRDPYSQQDTLEGYWYNPQQIKIGTLLFHGDGSFFAEYDVVQPHPTKKQWFVEAVTAWGIGEEIKVEPRLLPMPE